MSRLSPVTDLANRQVQASTYDRSGSPGIVHLGTGAFHRAHQAVYFDSLMQAGHHGWMIQGASLRRPTVANQLNPQSGLYTAVVHSGESSHCRLIRSIKDVIVAPNAPDALVAAIAAPTTQLVTLTITEKGYAGGSSAASLLSAGLRARFQHGRAPLTVISCDNLSENGAHTRDMVLSHLRALDPACAHWVEDACCFPSSMVDRIVPSTTPGDIQALADAYGYRDEAMVKTEPFSQWVIEDQFAGARPPLDGVGVQFVANVRPWELTKLRLLNGAHSAIAYLGGLAGHKHVDEAIAAPGFEAFIEALWDEAEVTLDRSAGIDFKAYRRDLVARFKNTALKHSTHQIAADGSQKLPQRILNTIRARRASGLRSPMLTRVVAGWVKWQNGRDDRGATFQVEDPLAEEIEARSRRAGPDWPDRLRSVCAFEPVFGRDMVKDETFLADLADHFT